MDKVYSCKYEVEWPFLEVTASTIKEQTTEATSKPTTTSGRRYENFFSYTAGLKMVCEILEVTASTTKEQSTEVPTNNATVAAGK